MVSIDDVARLAQVSTATVSRALSGRGTVSAATRERVLRAADRLGYVVSAAASSLATGRTRNVGVVVPHIDRWFFSTVLGGVAAGLGPRGYDITLYAVPEDAEARRAVFETAVRRRRVDAMIAVSLKLDDDETRSLLELDLPVIAIGGPNPRLATLAVDDDAVGRTAARHLLDLGHRRIAHIGAAPEFDREFRIPTQRRQGFEATLADAGVSLTTALFAPADFTLEGGARAATQLLRERDRPTAIFAASDEMAIGAVLAARDAGVRVPEDLSVVGVDGHELGEFFHLTTIDQRPHGQGERAAAEVLRALEPTASAAAPADDVPLSAASEASWSQEVGHGERGAGRGRAGVLPFELVVRETTAPPAG
ncbi:LacI family DNA-binding transcriptional regulator [Microbacterium sp. 10M-3C3]|jgi:DNA-binding LacI/PurR family transcriptional regulator|uniref:LacI family DNA-binding transcriptional regulator n=1 Tax=Microbacterium sp. 10M-3C3 TaxID=2483401 RepID=UPI000F62DC44|nr:LacI family DNA-binding transcriptional regulator [Microbacterium sp. 10M-3C3]